MKKNYEVIKNTIAELNNPSFNADRMFMKIPLFAAKARRPLR
jgi:hypothetical protein